METEPPTPPDRSSARERVLQDSYNRQQGSYRELEALYSAERQRTLDLQAEIDRLQAEIAQYQELVVIMLLRAAGLPE